MSRLGMHAELARSWVVGGLTGEQFLVGVRTGGVGGTSPVRRTNKSMLRQSNFSAETGLSVKISICSGDRSSSSTLGDLTGGTIPASSSGLGGAGGCDDVVPSTLALSAP